MILYDTIINVSLYQGDTDTPWFSINCPANGPKPHISLVTTQVQGGVCMQTKLTIRNLAVSQPDVRKITRMVIVAGYRNGIQQKLDCPVLTSYLASPMPNSEIVINGIAVGSIHGFLTPFAINMYFNQASITIKELTDKIFNLLRNERVVVDDSALQQRPDILGTQIGVSYKTLYADSMLSLVNWLNTLLDVVSNQALRIFIYNEGIKVRILDDKTKNASIIDDIELDYTTDAKFTGALLQLKAPWHPMITPGSVIRVKTNLFSAEQTPNVMSESEYISESDRYTVVYMTYNVDTAGDSSMDISAIKTESLPPAQFNTITDIESYAKKTINTDKAVEELSQRSVDIYFPQEPAKKLSDIERMYNLCFNNSTGAGWEQIDLSKPSSTLDIALLLEKRFGTEPILSVTDTMSKSIFNKAKLEGVNVSVPVGYKIYASQLYPYIYGCTYRNGGKNNAVNAAYPWCLNKHWKGTYLVFPRSVAQMTTSLVTAQFWKKAMNYFPKYSESWVVCAVLAYSQEIG